MKKTLCFLFILLLVFTTACSQTSESLIRLNSDSSTKSVASLNTYKYDKPSQLIMSPDRSKVILKYSYGEVESQNPLPLLIDIESGKKIPLKLGVNAWADNGRIMSFWEEQNDEGNVFNYGILIYDPEKQDNPIWKISLVEDKYYRPDKEGIPTQQKIVKMAYNPYGDKYILIVANFYADAPQDGLLSIFVLDNGGKLVKSIHTELLPDLDNNFKMPIEQELTFDQSGNMAFTAAGEKAGTAQDYIINLESEAFIDTKGIDFVRMTSDGFYGLTLVESAETLWPGFVINRYTLKDNIPQKGKQVLSSAELNASIYVIPERMKSFFINENGDIYILSNYFENNSRLQFEIYFKSATESMKKIFTLSEDSTVRGYVPAGIDNTGGLLIID